MTRTSALLANGHHTVAGGRDRVTDPFLADGLRTTHPLSRTRQRAQPTPAIARSAIVPVPKVGSSRRGP
jgi:hypothetical protein